MLRQIVQKIIPFRDTPDMPVCRVSIESSRESGDQIEFAFEMRQRLERLNRPDGARYLKEREQFSEQRKFIQVEALPGVTKLPGNEKKESTATPQIENGLRRRLVQAQILHPIAMALQPTLDVGIFGVVQGGTGVTLLDLMQSALVDLCKQGRKSDREKTAVNFAPAAFIGLRRSEFGDFV